MKKGRILFGALIVIAILLIGVLLGIKFIGNGHSVAIVIGEEENRDLAEKLREAMGTSVSIVTDSKETKAATEILIGQTNREQSVTASQGLREGDSWIRFYDGYIVIQGSTSEKLESVTDYFTENFVPAWKEGETFPTDSDSNYLDFGEYALQSLVFDDTEIYEYSIVTKGGEETEEALLVQQHIEAMSAYKLPIISSTDLKEGQKAIIFGSSAARKAEEKCNELGEKEFLIEADGDSLYLCAWNAENEYILSYMFLGETLGCQLYTDELDESVLSFEDYKFKFTTAYDGSGKFTSMCTKVAHYPVQNEFNILQGGCTDGEYIYLVMQDQTNYSGNCVILKVDPSNWEVLQISDPLPLDHGNSITYLPDSNELLVANLDPDPMLVSWVNASTLKYIKTEKISYSVSSLAWSQARQQFAGAGSSKVMLMIDKNLDIVKSFNGLASNYTNQGYVVDDDYVYIVSNSGNAIHVCDWEGHWIETIDITVESRFEMESLISFGTDMHYTTFINSGADIYSTIFYQRLYK